VPGGFTDASANCHGSRLVSTLLGWKVVLLTGNITNRWTGAAGACFASSLVRRRLNEIAPPGQLKRYTVDALKTNAKWDMFGVSSKWSPSRATRLTTRLINPARGRALCTALNDRARPTRARHNKSLDRSGGSVFRIKLGPAKVGW
jgi:hypothetical protein